MVYTPSSNSASQRYKYKNLEQLVIRVPKGKRDYYKAAASQLGLPLSQFIIQAMNEKIALENLMPILPSNDEQCE